MLFHPLHRLIFPFAKIRHLIDETSAGCKVSFYHYNFRYHCVTMRRPRWLPGAHAHTHAHTCIERKKDKAEQRMTGQRNTSPDQYVEVFLEQHNLLQSRCLCRGQHILSIELQLPPVFCCSPLLRWGTPDIHSLIIHLFFNVGACFDVYLPVFEN